MRRDFGTLRATVGLRFEWTAIVVALAGALACTPAPSPAPAPAPADLAAAAPGEPVATAPGDPVAPAPDDPVAPAPDPGSAEGPIADCEAAIAEYLSRRKALDHCERDFDCAEIWPGLCPHGPYYIHREAEIAPVWSLARRIEKHCEIPECEPPMALGIARCERGHCVSGRPPAKKGDESCWDFREIHLEAKGSEQARTEPAIRGITPHLVIAPKSAGRLRLQVEWPRACTDCTLLVSEHNSGMARLLDTTPKSTTDTMRNGKPMRRETIELQVTPGPYHMVAKSAVAADVFVSTELVDESGAPGQVTRHGESWMRMCEG